MIDNSSGLDVIELLPIATRTSSANGTGVDVREYEGLMSAVLHSAAGTGTSPTQNVKLQSSPDDSAWTDIAGAAFTEVDDTAGGSLQKITFNKQAGSRYVRAVDTIAGTSPSFDAGVTLIGRKEAIA